MALRVLGKALPLNMSNCGTGRLHAILIQGKDVLDVEISGPITFYEGSWASFQGWKGGRKINFMTNCVTFYCNKMEVSGKRLDLNVSDSGDDPIHARTISSTVMEEIELFGSIYFYEGSWAFFCGYKGGWKQYFFSNCVDFHS